ncbi:MAG: hypothetical protein EOO43_17860, partial [Flavobacterium sp.]
MTEAQRAILQEKKKQMALKLRAREIVSYYIERHWLRYYEEMLGLGMNAEIVHFHSTTEEELPHFMNAVRDLCHPLLSQELVKVGEKVPMDEFFDTFASSSNFKYTIELPVFSEYGGDPQEMIRKAMKILNLEGGSVYFMSNDVLPVLQLQLTELAEHATTLFDDG